MNLPTSDILRSRFVLKAGGNCWNPFGIYKFETVIDEHTGEEASTLNGLEFSKDQLVFKDCLSCECNKDLHRVIPAMCVETTKKAPRIFMVGPTQSCVRRNLLDEITTLARRLRIDPPRPLPYSGSMDWREKSYMDHFREACRDATVATRNLSKELNEARSSKLRAQARRKIRRFINKRKRR